MEQLSYAALESLAFGGYYLKDAPDAEDRAFVQRELEKLGGAR